jgi:hypothetical protein
MTRIVLTLVVAALAVGCSSPLTTREKGGLVGGAIGAGTGAIVGHQLGHTGAGALIGAGVGIVSGAVIGDAIQNAEQIKTQQAPPPPITVALPPPQVVVVTPPPIVVAPAPRMIWVPQWNAYVLEGYDVVYYDGAYYYFHNGYWWHSRSYAGAWVLVAPTPPGIARLPKGQLHVHIPKRDFCPPGLAKQGRC